MERAPGDEVNPAVEEPLEEEEELDVTVERCAPIEIHDEVHVAVRPRLISRHRAEEGEGAYSQLSQLHLMLAQRIQQFRTRHGNQRCAASAGIIVAPKA